MKNITVLGSTGSIGRQTLEVAAANPDKLKIRVLAAHNNVPLMIEQIEKVQPDFIESYIRSRGIVVLKKGALGGRCYTRNGIFDYNSVKVDAVDTTCLLYTSRCV